MRLLKTINMAYALIKSIIKSILPKSVYQLLKRNKRYRKILEIPTQKKIYNSIIKRIGERRHANIIFIASSLSMWRYDNVCEKFRDDSRFSVLIVIHPFCTFSKSEQRKECCRLAEYFDRKGFDYKVIYENFNVVKRAYSPDIIFYPQPYLGAYRTDMEWNENRDCLLCYMEYSVPLSTDLHFVDLDMLNIVWRFYVATKVHFDVAKRYMLCKGENAVIVGESRGDDMSTPYKCDPWKENEDRKKRKRIIWAPHFRINKNTCFNRPDFLWCSDIMIALAHKYINEVQFVFKPHPRLKSELYNHECWGKEKTDAYYGLWSNMINGQVSEGEYDDLFKLSDALIHNCGSFTAEYMYTEKPCAYTTRDIDEVRKNENVLGKECIEAHYIVSNENEIENFIRNVVLEGEDNLADCRKKVHNKYLMPYNGRSVGENIFNDIVSHLGL